MIRFFYPHTTIWLLQVLLLSKCNSRPDASSEHCIFLANIIWTALVQCSIGLIQCEIGDCDLGELKVYLTYRFQITIGKSASKRRVDLKFNTIKVNWSIV